jgi:cell division transport system permease protein
MITLAAQAALAANAQVITVLRLVGAQDSFIVRAFVRRFAMRGLGGAATGTVLGCLALLALPEARIEGGFLTGLGFRGWQWLWPLPIPPLAGLVAFAATRAAARRKLENMP